MPSFSFSSTGSMDSFISWLQKAAKKDYSKILEPYARSGANALAAATPVRSGMAASSWGYEVKQDKDSVSVIWTNSDVENGFPVVIMLQYGYATGTGGYVAGRDFINPALRPIFEQIERDVWREVTR